MTADEYVDLLRYLGARFPSWHSWYGKLNDEANEAFYSLLEDTAIDDAMRAANAMTRLQPCGREDDPDRLPRLFDDYLRVVWYRARKIAHERQTASTARERPARMSGGPNMRGALARLQAGESIDSIFPPNAESERRYHCHTCEDTGIVSVYLPIDDVRIHACAVQCSCREGEKRERMNLATYNPRTMLLTREHKFADVLSKWRTYTNEHPNWESSQRAQAHDNYTREFDEWNNQQQQEAF
jgi:hypothetical protein